MTDKLTRLDGRLYDYFKTVGFDEHPVLAELRTATEATGAAGMQISPEQGAFMSLLVQITGAKRILEIGTFTGYSTLAMALALPPDGRIVASDVSEKWTSIARGFWARTGLDKKIDLILKPGAAVIAELLESGETSRFDLVFIDADKEKYDHYYEGALKLLRPGGLILIDNVLWGGDVADPAKTDPDTAALKALNAKIRCDGRVSFAMVPIGDGLTLARKS